MSPLDTRTFCGGGKGAAGLHGLQRQRDTHRLAGEHDGWRSPASGWRSYRSNRRWGCGHPVEPCKHCSHARGRCVISGAGSNAYATHKRLSLLVRYLYQGEGCHGVCWVDKHPIRPGRILQAAGSGRRRRVQRSVGGRGWLYSSSSWRFYHLTTTSGASASPASTTRFAQACLVWAIRHRQSIRHLYELDGLPARAPREERPVLSPIELVVDLSTPAASTALHMQGMQCLSKRYMTGPQQRLSKTPLWSSEHRAVLSGSCDGGTPSHRALQSECFGALGCCSPAPAAMRRNLLRSLQRLGAARVSGTTVEVLEPLSRVPVSCMVTGLRQEPLQGAALCTLAPLELSGVTGETARRSAVRREPPSARPPPPHWPPRVDCCCPFRSRSRPRISGIALCAVARSCSGTGRQRQARRCAAGCCARHQQLCSGAGRRDGGRAIHGRKHHRRHRCGHLEAAGCVPAAPGCLGLTMRASRPPSSRQQLAAAGPCGAVLP